MRGGLLMACTLTLGVAFAAYAHSEDQYDIKDDDAAAVRFLEMLEPAQARVAVLPPDSPLIANWSNLPARITRFERNGVRAGPPRYAAGRPVRLRIDGAEARGSRLGAQSATAAEGILSDTSRASRFGWSPDNYSLAFFGEPSAGGDWRWQFGGHHMAINVAVTGGSMSMRSDRPMGGSHAAGGGRAQDGGD